MVSSNLEDLKGLGKILILYIQIKCSTFSNVPIINQSLSEETVNNYTLIQLGAPKK